MTNPQCTNTKSKAMDILHAMRDVDEKQYQQVIIETDSLLLKNSILKIWKVPWHIIEEVEEI